MPGKFSFSRFQPLRKPFFTLWVPFLAFPASLWLGGPSLLRSIWSWPLLCCALPEHSYLFPPYSSTGSWSIPCRCYTTYNTVPVSLPKCRGHVCYIILSWFPRYSRPYMCWMALNLCSGAVTIHLVDIMTESEVQTNDGIGVGWVLGDECWGRGVKAALRRWELPTCSRFEFSLKEE